MPANKTEGEENASPPKKKRILLILAAVVLGVALVSTFIFSKQVSAKGQTRKHTKKVEKGPVLALDEFLVNLADPGSDHFLKVTIGLELSKEKGKTPESLKEEIAPIRDAVLISLSTKKRDDLNPLGGRKKLKEEIKKRVNEALGEDDVQDVYFTNFVTQ